MKIYCVNLEIAKELQEKGFPQDTYFKWIDEPNIYNSRIVDKIVAQNYHDKEQYSAPSSDEIIKELPESICLNHKMHGLVYEKFARGKYFNVGIVNSKPIIYFQSKKLSNALAKMWLYLKKEGYIK